MTQNRACHVALQTKARAFVALFGLLLPLALSAAPVAILNGDFEQPTAASNAAPPGWFIDEQSEDYGCKLTSDGPHSGRQCIRMSKAATGTSLALKSRLYPCVPGEKYRASAWVFNETGDGWLYLEFYSGADNRVHEKHLGCGKTGAWQQLTIEETAPANAKYVGVLLYSSMANIGVSRFDDVAITGLRGAGDDLLVDTPVPASPDPSEAKMFDIGSRLELFVDDALIDKMTGLSLRLHEPVRREIAVTLDAPWDGDTSHYITVFKDDDRYRMYYRGSAEVPGPVAPHGELCAYAESKDGLVWTKPKLGIVDFQGNKDNAVVWTGAGNHNFTPFKDPNPAARPEERYKAIGGGPLFAFASPDGLHWKQMQKDPIITEGAFDSQNLAFFDTLRGEYVCYLRDFRRGVRDIRTCTSKDFLHWTKPKWLIYPGAPREHLYTNAITPYFRAPHIYMGFPKRFIEDRKLDPRHRHPGLSDGIFMTSRDGLHFHRWQEAFLRPGLDLENWTDRNNHIAYGIVPTSPEEISLYALEHYQHPTNRIRRLTLRTDGFVSVHADATGGEFTTKPLKFTGKELVMNFSSSIAGSVRVELQDEAGKPVKGFAIADCPDIYGDRIEQVVAWKTGADVSALQGQYVRLRFVMKDADLYSIRFRSQ